ncbi:hypothetical protein MtrunA17_Chr5g0438741 [Medicago truncatula]|uniref:Uncharacterized protein n=1 Tax=Medicago truncatula TaxID=3880 RepID=A0A396HXQ2_MEDTR|nr:hypothetical protein MtrunA17_Chr5g0438741 [Medicago truncatula]
MRHVFLKGYLMVMSYNLADDTSNVVDEMDNLMKHGVVDSCHFTHEEISLLIEMCVEYPKQHFGKANVYNNLVLAKDDLVIFITDKENDLVGLQPMYGSPERLWNNIINIAIKMGPIEDLTEVVGEDCFMLDFPLSFSVNLGMESIINLPSEPRIVGHSGYLRSTDTPPIRRVPCRTRGYYATSKCLVSDLQLVQMMLMSVFNVVENLGAFGIFGLPSGNVKTDPYFNSNLSNWGLRSEEDGNNSLLHKWKGFRGVPFFLAMMGNLRNVDVALAGEIREGVCSRLRPQLLHILPFSRCRNTIWGIIRGHKIPELFSMPSKQEKVKQTSLLKAFAWVMGLTKKVPMVGLNAVGQLFSKSLSNEELKFIVLSDGTYDLCLMNHKIIDQVL